MDLSCVLPCFVFTTRLRDEETQYHRFAQRQAAEKGQNRGTQPKILLLQFQSPFDYATEALREECKLLEKNTYKRCTEILVQLFRRLGQPSTVLYLEKEELDE